MNISIQQYRAKIGQHNTYNVKKTGSRPPSNNFSSMYDKIEGLVSTAGICINYILFIVCFINYLLDCLQNFILKDHPTTTLVSRGQTNMYTGRFFLDTTYHRIMISCIFYCMMCVIQEGLKLVSKSNYKSLFKVLYSRLLYKKSFFEHCANFYSLWIFSLNFILIALTLPNIINPGPINELNVLYHNVEGFVNLRDKSPSPQLFRTKLLNFQGHIFHEKPDIVILNETWLQHHILDSEIFPNNSYKVFRRDRSCISHPADHKNPKKFKKQGGGVIIAIRSDLDVKTVEFKLEGSPAKAEILSVVLTSGSGHKVCISTLYRVGNLGAENLLEVERHLKSLAISKSIHKHILIGDLNLNKTSWTDGLSTCSNESNFIELFNELGFDQLINEPTHRCGNTLDILLCNQPQIVSNIQLLPRNAICNSDHFGIKFCLKINCKRCKSKKRKIYNLKQADFRSINIELDRIAWGNLINNCDADTALHKFESIFSSICDRFIPKVTVKSSFQPPWFDSELDAICRRKNRLLDKYKRTNDLSVYEEIKKIRKTFKTTCARKKRDNIINDDDPALIKKKFWSYFKSTSNTCRIPETVNYRGRFRSENKDVANLFNKFFSDQFSSPSNYEIDINFENDPFRDIKFDEKQVFDLLKKK